MKSKLPYIIATVVFIVLVVVWYKNGGNITIDTFKNWIKGDYSIEE